MKVGELHITIWNNSNAEDALSNAMQDDGIVHDIVQSPVENAVLGYLIRDFGYNLDVEVTIVR